ncbi:PH domain-containing protein [Nakamurella lactea]|uniref:PH domain-containing protein n=1 Tax=Nakamurella lactea TaxID=459515 RepID=UPI0012B6522A|nr:PH domain-containing protein [Nakamurella lactea]
MSTDSATGSPTDHRLDPRTVPASALTVAGTLLAAGVPTTIGLRIGDIAWEWVLLWVLGGTLLLSAAAALVEWIRWRCSSFRIDVDRVEYTFALLGTKRTSLPRDRIRTVEITADPAQRLLNVADLRIGTGDQHGDLTLRSVSRQYAETLRLQLLHRPGAEVPGELPVIGELASFHPSWLRYAPMSFWTPVLAAGAFGVLMQVAGWFNANGAVLQWIQDRFAGVPLVWELLALAVVGLLVGAIGNLAIFIEGWFNYTLEREPDGALRIRRGLLVHRSTSFEENRVRGVALVEPLGIRAVGAARLDVLATGLRRTDDQRTAEPDTLMPAAPRAQMRQVAAAVLGTAVPDRLTRHPAAARRRRFVRAAAAATSVTLLCAAFAVLVIPALWWAAAAAALLLGGFAFWSAGNNYAALGHRVTDRHLVVRSGSIHRATEVLGRTGLLGWNLRQSPLQRRSGLVTMLATTAAGDGAIRLPDAGVDQAVGLLLETAPEWRRLLVEQPPPSN